MSHFQAGLPEHHFKLHLFAELSQFIMIPFQDRIADWRLCMLKAESRVSSASPTGKLIPLSPAASYYLNTVSYLRKTSTIYLLHDFCFEVEL